MTATPPENTKRGLRGKIIANKKEELTEYMSNAVALVKSYVPPEPDRLQASKDAGKMSITPYGQTLRLDFRDYMKPGDMLSVTIDSTKNTLLGLKVATWLEDANDAVTMNADFASLNDGATYPKTIALSAPTKSIDVQVTHSGYRKP